jgi:NifU-like protein involved in Fe-S cluster formation
MSATLLYTPEVLGLATSLSQYPWDDGLPLKGRARSKSCGSTIQLALSMDAEGRIDGIAVKSQACAIGQAAAAIFAKAAKGRSGQQIHEAARNIENWLAGTGAIPDWPGMEAIAAARDYPARHGAIMLAWNAARELLP